MFSMEKNSKIQSITKDNDIPHYQQETHSSQQKKINADDNRGIKSLKKLQRSGLILQDPFIPFIKENDYSSTNLDTLVEAVDHYIQVEAKIGNESTLKNNSNTYCYATPNIILPNVSDSDVENDNVITYSQVLDNVIDLTHEELNETIASKKTKQQLELTKQSGDALVIHDDEVPKVNNNNISTRPVYPTNTSEIPFSEYFNRQQQLDAKHIESLQSHINGYKYIVAELSELVVKFVTDKLNVSKEMKLETTDVINKVLQHKLEMFKSSIHFNNEEFSILVDKYSSIIGDKVDNTLAASWELENQLRLLKEKYNSIKEKYDSINEVSKKKTKHNSNEVLKAPNCNNEELQLQDTINHSDELLKPSNNELELQSTIQQNYIQELERNNNKLATQVKQLEEEKKALQLMIDNSNNSDDSSTGSVKRKRTNNTTQQHLTNNVNGSINDDNNSINDEGSINNDNNSLNDNNMSILDADICDSVATSTEQAVAHLIQIHRNRQQYFDLQTQLQNVNKHDIDALYNDTTIGSILENLSIKTEDEFTTKILNTKRKDCCNNNHYFKSLSKVSTISTLFDGRDMLSHFNIVRLLLFYLQGNQLTTNTVNMWFDSAMKRKHEYLKKAVIDFSNDNFEYRKGKIEKNDIIPYSNAGTIDPQTGCYINRVVFNWDTKKANKYKNKNKFLYQDVIVKRSATSSKYIYEIPEYHLTETTLQDGTVIHDNQ
jgi:hypothetical protein